MAYTCKAFVDNLADLTVTGVVRKYDAPPDQISSADLPAMYPRLPVAQASIISFTRGTGARTHQCELVVILKANNQSSTTAKHAEALTMIDSMHAAIAAAAQANGYQEWTIAIDEEVYGDSVHWVAVATVEGYGI